MIRYFDITFFDKKCVEVTEDQAEKVKFAIASDIKHIEINGNLYLTKGISRIEYTRQEYTKEEMVVYNNPFGVNQLEGEGKIQKTPEQIERDVKIKKEFIKKRKEDIYKRFGWPIK